jgi:hypothetical protein
MNLAQERAKTRATVRRAGADGYILTSLIAFAVTVIATRVFLELTGYPQIGNSVLHIAHALWGGLLLIVAVYLPFALANRWALQASALLGGVGIGLFIDEVGKFITQANDYFFAPALSIIYGFVLLNVFAYLTLRRPRQQDPRTAMYHVLDGLLDVLDGDLDAAEAGRLNGLLSVAGKSDRPELAALAGAIDTFLKKQGELVPYEPSIWRRFVAWLDRLGRRLGRPRHRVLILALIALWIVFVVGYVYILIQAGATIDSQVIQWRGVFTVIQVMVGALMILALVVWLRGNEDLGLKLAVSGFGFSLVALQTLYFYISQFSAITATLLQLIFLLILLAYNRWHLRDQP